MSWRAFRSVALLVVAVLVPAIVAVAIVMTTDDDTPSTAANDADIRNGRVFIQDNLWSTGNEQYAVWVAPDGTPFAGKRSRGGESWQVENLAKVPGNPLAAPTADDGHNVYAIAVDGRGYVHVAGNMHNDSLRYIRSRRPGDLTSWETGVLAGPAARMTYPRLAALPDGTLLFWRREGSAGHGGTVLDVLGPSASDWERVGTVLDGEPTGESPYIHDVAVDARSGTVHLMFEWRGGGDVATTNDVGYARSGDGGRSWTTSDGRRLTLPITHETAETVVDTAPTGSGLINDGGFTVDSRGRPHGVVVFDRPGRARSIVHVWRDGRRWRREDLDGSTLGGRPAIAGTPGGAVWLLGTSGDRIVAVEVSDGGAGARRPLAVAPRGWEVNYDAQALVQFGVVELLVPDGRTPEVVDARL